MVSGSSSDAHRRSTVGVVPVDEAVGAAAIADRATTDLGPEEQQIFLDALENGATAVTYDNPPSYRSGR